MTSSYMVTENIMYLEADKIEVSKMIHCFGTEIWGM